LASDAVPAALEALDPGLLALVEDLGRPSLAHLGVGQSGAADRANFRLANRLVGNRESAAALELTLGIARFRFATDATVPVTGTPAAVTVGVRPHRLNAPVPTALCAMYFRSPQAICLAGHLRDALTRS
jgi:allophanate hydrolase subunit 2